MGLFDSLWQGVKNIGDTVGLDGSSGYQDTWSQPQATNSLFLANHPSFMQNTPYAQNTNSTGLFDSLSNWYGNQTSKDWNNYANIAGSLGKLGLGYMQYKDAHALQKQQLADMNFNRQMAQQQYDNKVNTDNALNVGFQGSGLYDMYKKKRLGQTL